MNTKRLYISFIVLAGIILIPTIILNLNHQSSGRNEIIAEETERTDEMIKVNLRYLGEMASDNSYWYENLQLADYVQFVWWDQYKTLNGKTSAEQTFKAKFPEVDFNNEYIVVSFGKEIIEMYYQESSKDKIGWGNQYEGLPYYGEEYKNDVIYVYAMDQIPFVDSLIYQTKHNDIAKMNKGQMPDFVENRTVEEEERHFNLINVRYPDGTYQERLNPEISISYQEKTNLSDELIKVDLRYLGEVDSDNGPYYEALGLSDDVQFVWWQQYSGLNDTSTAEQTFKANFPEVDNEDEFMVISFGRKIKEMYYRESSKTKIGWGKKFGYEGLPYYGDEYIKDVIYVYAMKQIPFMNNITYPTDHNNIVRMNKGQMSGYDKISLKKEEEAFYDKYVRFPDKTLLETQAD